MPDPISRARPGWRELSGPALAWRAAHTGIAVAFLAAIAHVWFCALTGRRGPMLRAAVVALAGEGAVVAANGGDCPLGGLQERVDDPVPCFELVLPPRAAKLAVPVLGGVTAAGLLLLAARRPQQTPAPGSGSTRSTTGVVRGGSPD